MKARPRFVFARMGSVVVNRSGYPTRIETAS